MSDLTNVAWLLNLRGSDINFSPLFYAYVLVHANAGANSQDANEPSFVLWIQSQAVSERLETEIARLGGRIADYSRVYDDLREYQSSGGQTVCDGAVSSALVDAAGEDHVEIVKSPVAAAQAVKNDVELEGLRQAYARDGLAWVRWAAWLEEQMDAGHEMSEWDAAERLTKYRREGDNFAGVSRDIGMARPSKRRADLPTSHIF